MISFFSYFPGIDLEEGIKNLQCQMSLMADDINNLTAIVRNFASCKACIKKLYKATPEPEKLSPVLTPLVQAAPDPVGKRLFTPPAPTVTPDSRSKKLPDHVKEQSTTPMPLKQMNALQESQNGSPPNVVLIGSPSRGVYVKKEKLELIKTNLPKRFSLKLFELVFGREEAKDGSVEGKGEKLSRLDPNRLAAVQEETGRRFAQDNTYAWPEIKKAIDEKCRMVRNNRCFVWAGVNVNVTVKTD